MKTRAVILAGGEGTRLGVLTSKRAKPAVPFAGKYRMIDFPLSNCVNSNIFDVFIIAQYRPHSLIEHIGSGGPWDLNRDLSGGVRIYTPFRAPTSDWFVGTADAVQQNFSFIKQGNPDNILILSGDHIYAMDYRPFLEAHIKNNADVTIAAIRVPREEASRYGILGVDDDMRITSFVEKPADPPSDLANMGVYVFKHKVLDELLWKDHLDQDSNHDFGSNILPSIVKSGNLRVFAYPYSGYWMDVGTVMSYWQAHMDLLSRPPAFNLHNRSWVIHTRTEEQPPISIHKGASVEDSLICDGCLIESGARIRSSVLSPGVTVHSGAVIEESVVLTDCTVGENAVIQRSIIDKRVTISAGAHIGGFTENEIQIAMVGRNSTIPAGFIISPGGMVGTDLVAADFPSNSVQSGEYILTRRLPNEI